MDLAGKTAFISGGAIRVGQAIVLALARAGCNVFIHYNSSEEAARKTQVEAEAYGVKAWIYKANFLNSEETRRAMEEAVSMAGFVDILVNNAAIYLRGRMEQTSLENWNTQFQINLRAPFLLSQIFSDRLPQERQGAIINITDAGVFTPEGDHFAYRLTKSALVSMTEILARDLAPRIRVNAVALGIMMPLAGHEGKTLKAHAEQKIPMARIGSAEMVAENVLHLLRQDFITGVTLRLDGGEHI